MKLFLVECPIESCYVLVGFHLQLLSKKKLLAGGRGRSKLLVGVVKMS